MDRHASSARYTLHGAWIAPNSLSNTPFTLTRPSRADAEPCLLTQASFGVFGIWEFARRQLPPAQTNPRYLADTIIKALRATAGRRPQCWRRSLSVIWESQRSASNSKDRERATRARRNVRWDRGALQAGVHRSEEVKPD